MTTEYKLLMQDECTFTPQEKKEGDSEDMKRFQIIIQNPKNLMAYQVWNSETPKANAGTSKIFGIAPSLLVECIYNYNNKVKNVDGFTYQPTAWCILGEFWTEATQRGFLFLEEIKFGMDVVGNNLPIPGLVINAYTRYDSVMEKFNLTFPDKPFTGNIRMNINGFQSTAMVGILKNNFVEGWLKPTYNKLNPYPYIPDNLLTDEKTIAYDRTGPKVNFASGGVNVSIKNISSSVSRITVTNPIQAWRYFIWDPNNPFTNKNSLPKAEILSLNNIYTIFSTSENQAKEKGLPLDEYAWRPASTIDLTDENGKNVTYVGKIVNMETEFGKPNEEPTVMIDVDTSKFELYKNKRLSTLPSGVYNMIMDLDGLTVWSTHMVNSNSSN